MFPTKDDKLNCDVSKLNDSLTDLVHQRSYIHGIIDHRNHSDRYAGRLRPELSDNSSVDLVHLGRAGLCEFVRDIKSVVIHRKPGQQPGRQRLAGPMRSRGSQEPSRHWPPLPNPPPSSHFPPTGSLTHLHLPSQVSDGLVMRRVESNLTIRPHGPQGFLLVAMTIQSGALE